MYANVCKDMYYISSYMHKYGNYMLQIYNHSYKCLCAFLHIYAVLYAI